MEARNGEATGRLSLVQTAGDTTTVLSPTADGHAMARTTNASEEITYHRFGANRECAAMITESEFIAAADGALEPVAG